MKAVYSQRPNKTSKAKDILVDVVGFDIKADHFNSSYAHIKGGNFTKSGLWVSIVKLKPYLDPDADGKQWIFLNYIIIEQDHPGLLKYIAYKKDALYPLTHDNFNEIKKIIILDVAKEYFN